MKVIEEGYIYKKSDMKKILKIYEDYIGLNKNIDFFNENDKVRMLNLPEIISEGIMS